MMSGRKSGYALLVSLTNVVELHEMFDANVWCKGQFGLVL